MTAQLSEAALSSEDVAVVLPDMDCPSCVIPVRSALLAIPGVHTVQADLGSRSVAIRFDPALAGPDVLHEALTEVGFAPGAGASISGQTASGRPRALPRATPPADRAVRDRRQWTS